METINDWMMKLQEAAMLKVKFSKDTSCVISSHLQVDPALGFRQPQSRMPLSSYLPLQTPRSHLRALSRPSNGRNIGWK